MERRYRDMQDIEFTIEDGTLWLLQTRDGKRTAQAAVRIAVNLADEGLITQQDAVRRITPGQVEFFLHAQLSPAARTQAAEQGRGSPPVSMSRPAPPSGSPPSTPMWPNASPAMVARSS